MRVALVIPAYNEEELLPETIEGNLGVSDLLVVVNDGSTDATGKVAEQWRDRHPDRIEVIHQANTGIGGAVIAGMKHLLARSDVDAMGITPGDNQCDPRLVPVFRRILEDIPEIDVAKGSRFLHPETLHHMPRFRYWGNRAVSLTMQLILGYAGMSDVLHGYLLARRRVFERMDMGRITDGYDLENTMMAEFRRQECAFGLVPSPSRYGREKSSIVLRTQIPRTLRIMGAVLARRLLSGRVVDRLSPLLVVTGNPVGAWVAMKLTSPTVRIFPGPSGS
jgi:glycosyltransferase involved in cell wall biosynthesis